MAELIAKRAILFDGKNYKAGEELPTYNTEMIQLWLKCGSAKWDTVSTADKAVTAEVEVAEGNESGGISTGDEGDLEVLSPEDDAQADIEKAKAVESKTTKSKAAKNKKE